MSSNLITPINPISRGRVMLAVALVSCASLLLELALTRLFSVVLFYHFAFLAISVALLGLGAGGVFAYVRRPQLDSWSTRQFGFVISLVSAASILIALEVVLRLPISLDLTWWNFAKLSAMYMVCAVPFFFTGLMFSLVFAREAAGIGKIYGSDLLGGAVACMAVVPLLNWIGGPNAIVASAVLMAAAAAIWAGDQKQRVQAVAASLLLVLLIGANYSGKLIDIVYAKGVRRDQPWMLFSKWNAISRIEVDQVGGARYIVIDADASTAIMNVDPKKWEQVTPQPHDGVNLIPHDSAADADAYSWKKDLMSAAPSIANVLRPQGKFAIIGPGGGVDVLRAVASGSKDVTGIEINPIIANTIMCGNHADYSYNLYSRPEVRIIVGDGRSVIRNSKEQYDVVQMTLVDTWASTAAGAFALSENNLYTVEAFEEYFQHLKPDGFIAITRWEFKEPREALRVVSQALVALWRQGKRDRTANFIIVSDGKLDQDGRPVLVLMKKTPFRLDEILAVQAHVDANPNLHIVFLPGDLPPGWRTVEETIIGESPASVAERVRRRQRSEQRAGVFASLIHNGDPYWFGQTYPYNISPVYDKNPFFFFTLKTGHVFKNILAGTGRGMDWRINLGVTVLFMVFAISIVAVIAFLVLPLVFYGKGTQARMPVPLETGDTQAGEPVPRKVPLLYFIAVGLGFILVEIALIQRFVLFLGHPTYALTVVIFLMLLSSGVGSFAAKRWLTHPGRVWLPLLAIAAGVCAYLYVLPIVLSGLIGSSFALKVLISGILIVPLGFIMGMPFPTGLRAMSELNDQRIEWAWAMNAAASVLGSVSAMIIAIHFGLNVTLLCGAGAYALAAGMSRTFRNA